MQAYLLHAVPARSKDRVLPAQLPAVYAKGRGDLAPMQGIKSVPRECCVNVQVVRQVCCWHVCKSDLVPGQCMIMHECPIT